MARRTATGLTVAAVFLAQSFDKLCATWVAGDETWYEELDWDELRDFFRKSD